MRFPGTFEVILIILAVVLLFGAKKIPEIARGLGKGLKELKKAKDEIKDSIDSLNLEFICDQNGVYKMYMN